MPSSALRSIVPKTPISADFGPRRLVVWRLASAFSSLSRMPLQTLMQLSQM
jgi:hypothetical protein